MKAKTRSILQVLSYLLLVSMLASCSSRTKFVAPEIEPPADLIPGYVPEGFKLVSGFQLDYEALDELDGARAFAVARVILDPLLSLKSPAGNDILGLHYQDGDKLLLVSESYFPGGTLDLWRTDYEEALSDDGRCAGESDCDCTCCCTCVDLVAWPRLEAPEVQEVRTIAGTPVAILEADSHSITVFVRGEYLIVVDGDILLEENLHIVESLLGN